MPPSKPSSQMAPAEPAASGAHAPGQSHPATQPPQPAVAQGRGSISGGSTGGASPLPPPSSLAATSSPVTQGAAHAAAPCSPPSPGKQSDNGGVISGGGGGAPTAPDAGTSGPNSAPLSQQKYTKRSSDSGGGGGGMALGFALSPPVSKGASVSGAPPPHSTSFSSAAQQHSQALMQQPQQQAGGGSAGRRLQQLGQRLNFGLTLGRKKHATFAPGVSGGTGGGVGASSGPPPLSYADEPSSAGGAPSATGGAVSVSVPVGSHFSSSSAPAAATYGSGQGGSGAAGGGGGKLTAEEFNPPNHPVNPFSYLATPFRVMARTKAGVAMGRYATTALRLKRDGLPPASYMWLWLGNFKRWHRRYFVASEAPGVLLIYKRANMKGKVLSTSLCDATAVQDDSNPRQIRLVTPSGTIFLRVLRPEERQPWIACLRGSVQEYAKHKEVVDTLTAAAAAAGGEAGEGGVGSGGVVGAAAVAGALPSVASCAVDQDVETRRRIRARLNERLAEVAPLVADVERHLLALGSYLAGAAAGFGHLTAPLLHNSSLSQLSGRGVRSPGADGPGHITTAASSPVGGAHHTTAAAAAAAADGSWPLGLSRHSGGGRRAAEQLPPAAAPQLAVAGLGPAALMTPAGTSEADATQAAVLAAATAVHDRFGPLSRSRSRGRGVPPGGTAHSPTLAGAVAAVVDAFRATLHNEAVRIATLEAENAALNKTLNILRANTHRNAARARGASTPGLQGANAAAAAASGAATPGPGRGSGGQAAAAAAAGALAAAAAASGGAGLDDAASDGSACTADEDAFDIVEPFDEGVDYSILDDDAPHLHRRLGVDDDSSPYPHHHMQHRGDYPGGTEEEEEESDEDAEEDAEELAQQAEVLNALEVVRQVEYITAHDTIGQLKTLLTADTPPPPDAEEDEEEEEGGKGKRKAGRGKGEDTDATLDDEDDEDSEEAAGSTGGGAAGEGPAGSGGGGSGAGGACVRRPYAGRSRLPAPKPLGRGFSIWSILKNMIGRDLTKITMPATINEPLSMTQRMSEVLENRALLERAATTPTPIDRLMLVSCWLLAGYNSQPLRDNKPFNPLLGETFEWQAPDGSARYICEQVSHHPPVSCFVAEGAGPQGYELYGEVETKTKFWGKTIDCILAGHMALKLKAFGEEYRFNLGTLVINDIILGRFWIDLSCDMKIRNQQTGESARLVIKPCRGYPYLKERGKCDGVVCDAEGRQVWRISGSSMDSLFAALTEEEAAARGEGATCEPQLIWSKEPELPNPTEQYCMTRFALGLNDPADPVVPHLPPTDARFRPDMRALELGEWNRATSEKLRLEEKQRAVRRIRKEAGQEYVPRWFKQVLFNTKDATQPATQPGSVWEFTGEYWDARERKAWGELPDIY